MTNGAKDTKPMPEQRGFKGGEHQEKGAQALGHLASDSSVPMLCFRVE